ncbi:hypothetical protein R3P38DRAFT_3460250 [Favolaschia claudopus]|uniref:Uncharacterized protein n=1 Tax=Favolaschia claudopus TaxID=2862362 RepID=A0AAV9ZHK8_9AGAR
MCTYQYAHMSHAIQLDFHTHIHHFIPPTMTAVRPTPVHSELQELAALVARLSNASTEAMRLSIEVQTRLSVLIAGDNATATALVSAATSPAPAVVITPAPAVALTPAPAVAPAVALTPAPTVAPAAVPGSSAAPDLDPAGPLFVRGIPQTPAEVERNHPPGSGETWYVVILGREPGLYATALDADHQCNGVPHQYKVKKTSRVDALSLYRSLYNGPDGEGVEKWNEVDV